MKKKMAKAISILLVSLMLVAMFPTAFAAEDEATPVTVSMLIGNNIATSNINFGGNGAVSSGYTITWNDGSAVLVTEETNIGYFRQVYGLVDGKKSLFAFPAGHYTTAQFTFKTKIPADGYYAVSLIPILSQVGGTYGVWVNDQYAGSVNGWNGIAGTSGWTSTTTAGAEVTLNTLKLEADTDGYVKIKLKNLSTVLDTTIADSYKDAYVVPVAFQEFKLTPVEVATCTGISENISDKELYVGKTLDFVIAPVMSDGSTRYFDTSDANSYITAAVADGSSVTLSDMVMESDGLHGKISGVAAEAATISVAVTIDGTTTNHTFNVTPIAALVPTTTTVSMRDRGLDYSKPTEYNMKVTFNSNDGTRPGNGSFSVSKDTIQWLSSSTLEDYKLTDYTVNKNIEFVADKTNISALRELILKDAASGATQTYGTYNWPMGSPTSDVQFTFRTKLAESSYKVSIEPVISMCGCTYGVWVGGQYAGKVDTYEAHTGTWNTNAYAGAPVSLNTLDLASDNEGWVEVTIKKLSVPADNTSDKASIGFKDITFTPTDDLAVSSLSENISTTEIYSGETYDFAIKAVMNDGQIHKFDTSDTSNKITATVSSGSAVTLSGTEMKEDGLYGKITGVGEDEKATITVKTTINGETYTNTIDVISFATEVRTPETVTVSMVRGGELATTVDSADKYVFASTDKITWGEGDKIRLDYDKTVIANFRESTRSGGIWYPAIDSSNADAGFTVKVRATEGTYKVDATRAYSSSGCVYEIFVDGKSVGTIDGSGKLRDTDGGTDVTIGEKVSLNTVFVTPDENGWVEITVKYNSDGEATAVTGTTRYLLFKDITLTPTQKVYVTADTPSVTSDELITCEGDYEIGEIADVPFKSNLVLTANDTETNRFLYWINNSNQQVISEEATLTLSVTSNATISAVYAESGNTRYDYFTATGQRIASYFGNAPATEPEIPSMVGFTTGGEWTEDNSYETDDYVAYAPDYTNADPKTFEATIDGEEKTVTYDEKITVTADDSDFSYWTKGGKIVSLMKEYTFYAWGDEDVEKVCDVSVTANDRKPQVVLFKSGNDYMLELVACEDVEIVEKGILFANSGTPTIGSAITKAKSNSDSLQFTASSTYSAARAYLVYRDDDGVKVVYSK